MLDSDVLKPEYAQSHPKHGQVRERGLFELRERGRSAISSSLCRTTRRGESGKCCYCARTRRLRRHMVSMKKKDVLREKTLEVEGMCSSCVSRMTLKRAMQAVIFSDGDRRRRRRRRKEYNEAFGEHWGIEDEP